MSNRILIPGEDSSDARGLVPRRNSSGKRVLTPGEDDRYHPGRDNSAVVALVASQHALNNIPDHYISEDGDNAGGSCANDTDGDSSSYDYSDNDSSSYDCGGSDSFSYD